jgi:hypothetical protein
MHQVPTSIAVLGALVCVFFWAHFALALVVRFMARIDEHLVNELFASPPLGGVLPFGRYMMRLKLFFPWVVVNAISRHSSPLRAMMWSARIAGGAWLISFICFIGDFVYLASRGA